MEQINNAARFNELLKPHLKRGVRTNNFMLPQAYFELIADNRLFLLPTDAGLFLLVRMDGYYRLFYHFFEGALPLKIAADLPVVVELPYNDRTDTVAEQLEFLQKCGLQRQVSRIRLSAERESLSLRATAPVSIALPEQANDISALLRTNFDRLYGFLPTQDELRRAIAEGQILITSDGGNIAGILHFAPEGRNSVLLHLAVEESSRGQGFAQSLLAAWQNATDAQRLLIWLNADNTPALRLYERCGFAPDGFRAEVLTQPN